MTERLLRGTAADVENGMRLQSGQVGFGTGEVAEEYRARARPGGG